MDSALKSIHEWSPRDGYFLTPEGIYDDRWKNPQEFNLSTRCPKYLKLHGSTNWLVPYHGVDLSTGELRTFSKYYMDKLFIFLNGINNYETYEDRYWGPYSPFSYCYYPPNLPGKRDDIKTGRTSVRIVSAPDLPTHAKTAIGEDTIFSMPLIVPPVRDKQYMRYGRIFSELWEQAEEEIRECHELYIIGYSFPDTDFASKNLFNKALQYNNKLKMVTIINPFPERIREILINEIGVKSDKIRIQEESFSALSIDRSGMGR